MWSRLANPRGRSTPPDIVYLRTVLSDLRRWATARNWPILPRGNTEYDVSAGLSSAIVILREKAAVVAESRVVAPFRQSYNRRVSFREKLFDGAESLQIACSPAVQTGLLIRRAGDEVSAFWKPETSRQEAVIDPHVSGGADLSYLLIRGRHDERSDNASTIVFLCGAGS